MTYKKPITFEAMKAATIIEIKRELGTQESVKLAELCLRLAKYKKDNKEMLTYLLLEADNETSYIESVKQEIEDQFQAIPNPNLYYVKKSLRKILRMVNKQIRYSGLPQTDLEIRIHYCKTLKNSPIPLSKSPVISNLYQQQIKKIKKALAGLPEDLQYDYQRDVDQLS